jgi:CRISPR-associated endonuclease/helicase Cas3
MAEERKNEQETKSREFYAHTDPENPELLPENGGRWQLLKDHLEQTARLARQFASAFKAGDWGYLAGLWHDIGKYSDEFQQRLRSVSGNDEHIETPGKVDHSTAGAQHAASFFKDAGKILAYNIAGHHGGLPDGNSTDSCLRSRLTKTIPSCKSCPQEILLTDVPNLPFKPISEYAGMQFSLFIRMVYSCLVDADFLDTEAFMEMKKADYRKGYPSLQELEVIFFDKLNSLRSNAKSSTVNQQRDLILQQCLATAEKPAGLFSLTVPTGGGKTLSSMAFALKHAARHKLKKIIYVIPFTSIIEQNAAVFREMMGESAILEHHSNFEPKEEDYRSRLASENWDAPIIVATNVQFFESFFSNRSSRCRKLHNIAESILILDEVQTLPAPYLLPCLAMLRDLSANYKTTVVFCSATQPAIQKRLDFKQGLENVIEIIDSPQTLAEVLKRTQIHVLDKMNDMELAVRLSEFNQVLCIVNTRKQAKNLFKALNGKEGTYHLSALMCPVHRSKTLKEIRKRLQEEKPCRVISTQLIEAGVDIDFPVVFRTIAGIDSIAQAAGRCNREGRLPIGEVFVFTPDSGIPAGHFRQTAQAAESVLRRYSSDILSLEAIEEYFKLYYWTKGDALDEERILTDLQAGCQKGDFPFKTIAEKFRFIKEEAKPVIIPFDEEARRLIQSLDYRNYPTSISRKLQKYTVSIYPNEWSQLLSIGSIQLKAESFPVLVDETLYNQYLGLCGDDPFARDPESLFV